MSSGTSFSGETGIDFDPYQAFVASVPQFVDLARHAAATQANSYRDFRVGATLYAGNDNFSEVVTLHAANSKPAPDAPKYCAEMGVIDQAKALGFTRALGLVVAGPSDPNEIKEITGKETPTLSPCQPCQERMSESGLFTSDSVIVTVATDRDIYEVTTFGARDERRVAKPVRYNPNAWRWAIANYARHNGFFQPCVPRSQLVKMVLGSTVGRVR